MTARISTLHRPDANRVHEMLGNWSSAADFIGALRDDARSGDVAAYEEHYTREGGAKAGRPDRPGPRAVQCGP